MIGIIIYALLSAAMFYLGSRALITKAIWSAYPANLAAFMDCAACTGFWWGVGWSAVLKLDVGFLVASDPTTPILIGILMIVPTPIAAGLMQWGLDVLGTAVPTDDE